MKKTNKLSPNFPAEKQIFLNAFTIGSVEVDVCPLSGGIWFDRFEVKNFDEAHEDINALLAALPKNPVPAEITKQRKSPSYPEMIMMQQPYGPKGMQGNLVVDICPKSSGIWLDYSEIQKMRKLYPKESDRQKCIEDFVNSTYKPQDQNVQHSRLGLSKLIFKLSE